MQHRLHLVRRPPRYRWRSRGALAGSPPSAATTPLLNLVCEPIRECLQLVDADLPCLEPPPFICLVVLHAQLARPCRDRREQTLDPFVEPVLVSLLLLLLLAASQTRCQLWSTRYVSSSSLYV